ncbi:hypothetical protein HMPREF9080_01747 [Cardiobacterium valvarum F0432]|uniref:Uncharacterized protein n=1 Tax=Cardiobacterium valvarum F0432 TaxID=797473 RepID=G9ZG33_9GAMM|nr:hypothetical protein HMPREF9080_01747 [Cardiobacterium valvarum F0432]
MHPRVAHNYAKQGYYPTDDGTLRGIDHLLASSEQPLKFLDPCCGCGDALVYLARVRSAFRLPPVTGSRTTSSVPPWHGKKYGSCCRAMPWIARSRPARSTCSF